MATPRIDYDDFRTGLTFAEVRQMLWVHSDDPRDWRYKRRRTVLGLWHSIKQQLYARYVDELDAEDEADFRRGGRRRRGSAVRARASGGGA